MAHVTDHIGIATVTTASASSSPIKDGDHYVLHKLSSQLLPWMICGSLLRRQWMVRIGNFYGYTSDLAAALAGLGIGAPVAALISGGKSPEGKSAFDVLRDVLPTQWFLVGVIALVVWIALRIYVQREDVLARALLARECAHSMRSLRQQLYVCLSDPDPMPAITKIQKSVEDQVQNAIRNKVWPWDPLPSEDIFAIELANNIDKIRVSFMSGWALPPPGGRPA